MKNSKTVVILKAPCKLDVLFGNPLPNCEAVIFYSHGCQPVVQIQVPNESRSDGIQLVGNSTVDDVLDR